MFPPVRGRVYASDNGLIALSCAVSLKGERSTVTERLLVRRVNDKVQSGDATRRLSLYGAQLLVNDSTTSSSKKE